MKDIKRTGQNDFFSVFYEDQFQKMWKLAVTIVHNSAQAEEIVQDAFVEFLVHLERLKKEDHPEFWLQKVVKNKSLHVLRERNRCAKALAVLESQRPANLSEPKEFQEVEESDSGINQKISDTLNERELYLLRRIAMEGAKYKTVAEETGMTISACQKKIQRIRKKLEAVIPFY